MVVGHNAAGKTNLLEAMVVLSRGSSHRTQTDRELIAWGEPLARIEGRVSGSRAAPDTVEVVLLMPGAASAGRKRIRVNGVPRRAGALAATFRSVLFAPEDMLLVAGGPSLRRASLDTLVTQLAPGAAASMSTYARTLVQRNNLLRRVRDGSAARDELRFWDESLVMEGARIVTWRAQTLGRIAEPLARAHREIAPGEGRLMVVTITNAPPVGGEGAEGALRRRLAETADKELWNGATLIGPHRDDIAFQFDGRDLAGFASRGQQRTAILAWKLAQLDLLTEVTGDPPLLLLDDVFSELDPQRRAHLVRRIGGLPQAFVTTTALDDLDPALVRASTAWRVEPGRIGLVA